jgi:hypothetical protein
MTSRLPDQDPLRISDTVKTVIRSRKSDKTLVQLESGTVYTVAEEPDNFQEGDIVTKHYLHGFLFWLERLGQ